MAFESWYDQVRVSRWEPDGSKTPLPGVDVIAYDTVDAVDLGTFTTDSDGVIPSGVFGIPVGRKIIFRVENYDGMANCIPWTTTESP